MKTDIGQTIRLEDYRPTDFIISAVDLTFRLNPDETQVTCRMTLSRRNGTPANAPLVLDGDELEFMSLKIDDRPAAGDQYDVSPSRLEIRNLPESGNFRLEIVTEIAPAKNTKLMGLFRSNNVYCSQCEAEGFRRITYFLDRPDVLAVYTTRIEANRSEAPLLLSNGNPVEKGDLEDGWHYALWHDPHPKPSYLFALVAGDLAVVREPFITRSGKAVTLEIYVEHGKEVQAGYAMDALKRSMRWDEERFGREYDLSIFMIVAVSDFNMGAMENKGLNVFNDKFILADPDTATDADYAHIEAIIAHEYFHNWTGNRITCRDWFQLCLKEGLTVYRDHEFSADMRSRPVKRIAEVRLLKAHQFPEDSGPLAHPVRPVQYSEINNFYTATVYEKGSEVVRMLATVLGQADFSKGLDLYFERHDGQAATIEDFIACFETAATVDLTQFSRWYHQAGTPAVAVTTTYDRANRELEVQFEQSIPATPGQSQKMPMHIPLRFGLFAANGDELATPMISGVDQANGVLHLKQRSHSVVFKNIRERPVLSLNRSFSAPINIHFEQSADDLALLAKYETNAYSRWQSLNKLATDELVAATNATRANTKPVCSDLLLESLLATAVDITLEPALRSQALTLPGEADIAREIGTNIDTDAIHVAHKGILGIIAKTGLEDFNAVLRETRIGGPFSPDATSAGQRALYLTALSYLARHPIAHEELLDIYRSADNMTVLSGVLVILAHQHQHTSSAKTALADFETRFRDNPLVIDKWLTIQATVPGSDTLDQVRNLMQSPHFSIDNPNRVRALIGSFVAGNPTGFNSHDGKGHAFLAEQVIALDSLNPQVAARMLTAMRSWQSLEPVRRENARAALASISDVKTLSMDVRDIVNRTLGLS